MSDTYIAPEDVREHARRSALAGRPIYVNPHLGGEAELWFIAYRAVPVDQCGSQPELLTSFRTIHARARKSTRPKGVTALGMRSLKGHTPLRDKGVW
jgi:hypothetical protein